VAGPEAWCGSRNNPAAHGRNPPADGDDGPWWTPSSGDRTITRGRPRGRQEHDKVNVIQAPPQAVRPLTDHPTVEATALRGLWFGLLIAIPFWLLMAALSVRVL
jgi:hypothetical protein